MLRTAASGEFRLLLNSATAPVPSFGVECQWGEGDDDRRQTPVFVGTPLTQRDPRTQALGDGFQGYLSPL